MNYLSFGAAVTMLVSQVALASAEPVKIGLITSLSGSGGYVGADIRDGFQLAADLEDGKLGGVPVQIVAEDDGAKPGQGKQIVNRMLKTDGIKLFTGIAFSNVLGAAVPDILDADAIYVGANAAPSNFAGKDCHKNYFVASWQNDGAHESAGQIATDLKFKRAFIVVPNYQAGKDAIAGFKRFFKGEIVGEIYTRLDQTDFASEMAQVRAAKPDVLFQFHPGGLGLAFIRQYQQAKLNESIPMVAAYALDSTILKAVGDSALGIYIGTHWNADMDNPANKAFMAAWSRKYGADRLPTNFAAQGYDTALAIGAALKKTGGDLKDLEKFRQAMIRADFASVRGPFKFGPNQHPIQNWYSARVEKDANAKPVIKTVGQVFSDHGDSYAKDCKL